MHNLLEFIKIAPDMFAIGIWAYTIAILATIIIIKDVRDEKEEKNHVIRRKGDETFILFFILSKKV